MGEEHRKPESIFDFLQAITAFARGRLIKMRCFELEGKASA
ncbi:hypothetical protein [Bradyrhizobium diazoefficiens]